MGKAPRKAFLLSLPHLQPTCHSAPSKDSFGLAPVPKVAKVTLGPKAVPDSGGVPFPQMRLRRRNPPLIVIIFFRNGFFSAAFYPFNSFLFALPKIPFIPLKAAKSKRGSERGETEKETRISRLHLLKAVFPCKTPRRTGMSLAQYRSTKSICFF